MKEHIIIELHRMMALEEIAAHREFSQDVIEQMNVVIKELHALKVLMTND